MVFMFTGVVFIDVADKVVAPVDEVVPVDEVAPLDEEQCI